MSTQPSTKINQLLSSTPSGIVMEVQWLNDQGYSRDLVRKYRASGWLQSIGTGAVIRAGETVGYEGAIFALQQQSGMSVHPAGRTALAFLGKTHYLELSAKYATVFGGARERLPGWFTGKDWNRRIHYYATSFLPENAGLTTIELSGFSLKISSAERAILECLYLAPKEQDLVECYEMLMGLNNLRPNMIQSLLEKCSSVKVKRLFLFMAEKSGHDWVHRFNKKNINLGAGKRSIVPGGVYDPAYRITISQQLMNYDSSNI